MLGDQIRKARKAKGLTQSDLAKLVGTDQCRVSKWERNKNFPNRSMWEKLSEALNYVLVFEPINEFECTANNVEGHVFLTEEQLNKL